MTITIREATPEDVYLIIALQARIWVPASSAYLSREQMDYMFGALFTPEALKKDMQSGQCYLILSENDIPMGFASHCPSDTDQNTYHLKKVFILPEGQGKGFGTRLIRHIEEIARNRKSEFLTLFVNRRNPAQELYKKLGFDVIEEVDKPFGPYFMNDYKMRKAL